MASPKILLPYNFSAYDHKALNFVIQHFSRPSDVEITLFYAYTPVPEIETRESPVMDKLKGNLNYLSQRIQEQEAGLKVAKQNLLENGFAEEQVRYIFKPRTKDIAGEIVDLALSGQYDMLVINHKPGKVTRFFTGNVFSKVVNSSKDITVCVVT